MTAPSPLPPPTRAQNAMGFLAFVLASGVAIWQLHLKSLSTSGLGCCLLVGGAGMWFVGAPLLQAYVTQVREVAPLFLRRATDGSGQPVEITPPADRALVVHRTDAPTVVVPPRADPAVVASTAPGVAGALSAGNGDA